MSTSRCRSLQVHGVGADCFAAWGLIRGFGKYQQAALAKPQLLRRTVSAANHERNSCCQQRVSSVCGKIAIL
jgi:hypothetical protein